LLFRPPTPNGEHIQRTDNSLIFNSVLPCRGRGSTKGPQILWSTKNLRSTTMPFRGRGLKKRKPTQCHRRGFTGFFERFGQYKRSIGGAEADVVGRGRDHPQPLQGSTSRLYRIVNYVLSQSAPLWGNVVDLRLLSSDNLVVHALLFRPPTPNGEHI